jgi:lipid-A-disaccharide synthase-like uncharacterized protein
MTLLSGEQVWWAFGFAGEAFFGLRFVVQWIATERHRKSVVPVAFWYMSLLGAAILLSYAIHRRDPVFIAGLAPTIPIYLRNLYFIHRGAKGQAGALGL